MEHNYLKNKKTYVLIRNQIGGADQSLASIRKTLSIISNDINNMINITLQARNNPGDFFEVIKKDQLNDTIEKKSIISRIQDAIRRAHIRCGKSATDKKNDMLFKLILNELNNLEDAVKMFEDRYDAENLTKLITTISKINDLLLRIDNVCFRSSVTGSTVSTGVGTSSTGTTGSTVSMSVTDSKVNRNLQWYRNSCWIDSALLTLFTYDTDISNKILNYHATTDAHTVLTAIFNTLMTGNDKIKIMDSIDVINDACRDINTEIKNASEIVCDEFVDNRESEPILFINLLTTLYDLPIKIVPELTFFDDIFDNNSLKLYIMNAMIENKQYLIVNIGNAYQKIGHNICGETDSIRPDLANVKVCKTEYTLACCCSYWTSTVEIEGKPTNVSHYTTILYQPMDKSYILINKLSKDYIYRPTKTNWNTATTFFYYPTDKLVVKF